MLRRFNMFACQKRLLRILGFVQNSKSSIRPFVRVSVLICFDLPPLYHFKSVLKCKYLTICRFIQYIFFVCNVMFASDSSPHWLVCRLNRSQVLSASSHWTMVICDCKKWPNCMAKGHESTQSMCGERFIPSSPSPHPKKVAPFDTLAQFVRLITIVCPLFVLVPFYNWILDSHPITNNKSLKFNCWHWYSQELGGTHLSTSLIIRPGQLLQMSTFFFTFIICLKKKIYKSDYGWI